jgi:hypothetical protein
MIAAVALAISLWTWDAVPNADGYHFYWSRVGTQWDACDMVEVTANEIPYPTAPEPLPGEIIYITVSAFNAAGESAEDHGPVAGCTAADGCPLYPTFPCP